MASVFGDYEVHLRDYLYVLRKRRMAIVIFFAIVIASAVILTFFEKVLFKASSTILIERENPNVVDFKEVMALDASSTDYYQTQYQMLRSRSLIRNLIDQEKLETDPFLAHMKKGRVRPFLKEQKFFPVWLREFIAEPSFEDLFIKRMLQVNPVRNSRLVEVSVLHPDASRSAQLTNGLVALFIQRNLEDRFTIANRATELLSKQLIDLKEKVGAAERKLQEYKEEHGLVKIQSIREKNEFLQDAKLELVKIQSEEAKLAKRYLPEHPKQIHIRSQIEGLQSKIDEEEKKILSMGRIAIDYGELEREAESSRQIYESLLSRLQQTASEAKTQASNIMLVDKAQPPPRPYKPRPFLNLMMAIFIGVFGGICLAFFREYLDSTIKIPDDVEKGMGLELLGIIPEAERIRNGPAHGELFLVGGQHSPAAESIRALRTALLFQLRHVTGCRVLLVTSPNPEEGKSTVVLNLASAFQQNHLKVLLIDADLRKPKLHKLLDVTTKRGLSETLEGELSPAQSIHKNVAGLGFDFMSCGAPSHHPTELLGSEPMKGFIQKMMQEYDIILLDSPPHLAVADVSVLSEFAMAILIIARYQRTDRRHLRDVKRRFNNPATKVLGIVINQVSVREKDYYYHQYYYYGYGDADREQ